VDHAAPGAAHPELQFARSHQIRRVAILAIAVFFGVRRPQAPLFPDSSSREVIRFGASRFWRSQRSLECGAPGRRFFGIAVCAKSSDSARRDSGHRRVLWSAAPPGAAFSG
jgi:hypothetical protein